MISKNSKIYIAGHNGMVGSAILRILKKQGYKNLIYENRNNLDLSDQSSTYNFLKKKKPDVVFVASAKVGGIFVNQKNKADFISDNLSIQNNLIIGSFKYNVKKLIFLSSSCAYPKDAPRPLKEKYLFSGKLEETNAPYAVAKLAGMKLCESYNKQYKTDFKTLIPCNLYGENDNFNEESSHFFPALIRKVENFRIGKTKSIKLWGNGKAKRELMHVDDLADAAIFFMKKKLSDDFINIGTGKQYSIIHYAKKICAYLDVKPNFEFDMSKPNGMKTKVLDTFKSRKYGWSNKVSLKTGIKRTYKYFIENYK